MYHWVGLAQLTDAKASCIIVVNVSNLVSFIKQVVCKPHIFILFILPSYCNGLGSCSIL